jgi:uncharacterized protein (DUF1499 family)
MNRLIVIILGISIALFTFPSISWAAANNLGVNNQSLASCPQTPNCIVSQSPEDETHAVEPIAYQTDLDTARATLLKVLNVVPRTKTIEQTPNYIHAESTSRIFKFVDDLEFYFPSNEKVIHVRSAARVGESDLGVNRTRLEQIRLALADLKV